MSEKNFKLIRKQIRNVLQDMVPSLLQNELVDAVHAKLASKVNDRLTAMNASMQKQLDEINSRSKDVQAYVVQQLGANPAAALPTVETPAIPNDIVQGQ